MKRLLVSLIALSATLLMASCAKEQLLPQESGSEASVSFMLGLQNSLQTKTIGDGTGANKLVYAVFDSNGENVIIDKVEKNVSFPAVETITLAKGQSYKIAFWAQNDATSAYTISKEMVVSVDYEGALGNDETRDAFFKTVEVNVTGDAELDVELTRPFAQINVGVTTKDWNDAMDAGIAITESKAVVKQAASTLNLLDGTVEGPVDVTFDFANIPTDDLSVDLDGEGPEDYKYLSMNYILTAKVPRITSTSP